jgi:filamentous hemagglutinin
MAGAKEVAAPPSYAGKWYARPDGTVFGLRNSNDHGPTIEVIQGGKSGLINGFKVHRK